MNNQEAIKEFKEANRILRGGDNGSYRIAKTIVRNELAISALEAQQADRWIPVTERLPEEKEETRDIYDIETLAAVDTETHMVSDLVQVTVKDSENDKVFVCDDCTVDGKWSNFEETTGCYKILAWKPLPEPWKEEQS